MSKKVEKPKRGLFIDFEGFIQSSNDENFIKTFSSELNKNFKLFTFIDIPKEKEKEIQDMQSKSPKLYNRASLMLSAHSRELKRIEMLEQLSKGNNIITINYCFNKILNAINEYIDINFAKKLFRGLIHPDIIIYHKCEKDLEQYFAEYKIINNYTNDRDNIIEKYRKELKELYKITLRNYEDDNSQKFKNYYPHSIGEDLFIYY